MLIIKKILGALLILTVVFSAGLTYANVDPAAKLSNWYSNSFQKQSEQVGITVISGMWTTYKEAGSFMSESKDSIDSAIDNFRDNQVREAKNGIVGFLEGINSRLDQTIAQLKEENLDGYAENTNVEEEIERDSETMLVELLRE